MLKFILLALALLIVLAAVWLLLFLWRAVCGAAAIAATAFVKTVHAANIAGAIPQSVKRPVAEFSGDGSSANDFHRLARAAMVYATRPGVTVMHQAASWPDDQMLIRTTSDAYGRRAYIESQRLIAGKVVHTVCLYIDGADRPADAGSLEFPAEQVCVGVLTAKIEDIVREGVFMSFRDLNGRIRETRIPKEVKHHA